MDARLDRGVAEPVALGLSGGSDSLALLGLAADWCARAGRPLLALTVDHGLSPDSSAWTAAAQGKARALGAQARALPWTGPKPTRGLPAAARTARHALLAEAAREAGARVILLGHTADDVAEGDLMRAGGTPGLGRVRAWAPSPAWPQGRGVFLLRPLLSLSRGDLRAWLRARDETDWVEDPANADPRYARARARAQRARARAQAPPAAPAATGPAHAPSGETAALAAEVQAHPSGRLAWSRAVWLAASAEAQGRVLAAAATCAGGGQRPPRAAAVGALARTLQGPPAAATLAGARIAVTPHAVVVTRAAPRGAAAAAQTAGDSWDGRFALEADHSGLRVARLAGRAARLSQADRRALLAVPADARAMLPVLVGADGDVHLPRPFGAGPGAARSLVAARLRAACGGVRREADLA